MSKLRFMVPSPHSLFVFEAAARNLNFKLAAAELCVTQPSISHSIKGLERHCNVELFIRDNRGVQLTDAGRVLYEGVQSGFFKIEQSMSSISSSGTKYLTVAASTSMAAHWLVPNLPIFQQENPGIKIKVVTTDRDIEPDSQVDLTIWLRPKEFRRSNSWFICDEVIFPVCSPSYLASRGPVGKVGDLLNHQVLHSHDTHRKRMGWNDWLSSVGLHSTEVAPNLVYNDYQLAVQAALAGEGIVLGWSLTLQPLLKRGLLVKPLTDSIRTDNAFFLIASERGALLERIEPLVNWILAETRCL